MKTAIGYQDAYKVTLMEGQKRVLNLICESIKP